MTNRLLAILLILCLGGCAAGLHTDTPFHDHPSASPSTVILVSIDGFRNDYIDRGVTPNLRSLMRNGVFADAMRPSYPTKTFPNHYTLVTGRRPDQHGIIDNVMRDPAIPGVTFKLSDRSTVQDGRWWGAAEPIWVSAEKAGVRTATMYWPGSEAPISGIHPSDWRPYDNKVTADERVDQVLEWLARPASERPRFVALYFNDVDDAGHAYGPNSDATLAALKKVDAAIGRLRDGLTTLDLDPDLIIVSDHGMAETGIERLVLLNTFLDPASYEIVSTGTHAGIYAKPGYAEMLDSTLPGRHDHATCWRKDQIPSRLEFGTNTRVPSYFCAADVGWLIYPSMPKTAIPAGSHGYDNEAPEMQALFVASGPDFNSNVRLGEIDNIDVYPLVMDLLALPTGQCSGRIAVFADGLAKER